MIKNVQILMYVEKKVIINKVLEKLEEMKEITLNKSNNKITANEFQGFLDKINLKGKFQISDHYIKLDGTYWQEEISYLRHISKKNVKADNLLKRVDEFLISQ